MLAAGWHNIPLTRYLIDQVRLSHEAKVELLKEYVPSAQSEDWDLEVAGQRVQVIKKDEEEGGILEFGTEVVNATDGSLAALLGASPGASTVVSIMLSVLQKCFPEKIQTIDWQRQLKMMIPSYKESLASNEDLAMQVRARTSDVLNLSQVPYHH
jgi:malate dehydrogenase (quinone)